MLSFSPKKITKELLLILPERTRDILIYRYGLGKKGERRTLESIGSDYGITRERVRQVESHGLSSLRNPKVCQKNVDTITELEKFINSLGGVLSENELLSTIPKTNSDKNFVHFLLTVWHPFTEEKENADFVKRWNVNQKLANNVYESLSMLHDTIDENQLIPEDEFIKKFSEHLSNVGVKENKPSILNRWLAIAKKIGQSPLGEWGRASSPNIRVKGMRDFAYLTLKRNGSPMHFTEVAKMIEELFGRHAHSATCHNELIKDSRFVLVGRGLYALNEWGYEPGIVKDVIKEVLQKDGPLVREDIIERVKRERYVKDATISVNLQDGTFVRLPDGRYNLA